MATLSSSRIRLVVCDLWETLTHGDPMVELIQAMLPQHPDRHVLARNIRQRLENNSIDLKEAIQEIAYLGKNGSLRRAVEYATFKMKLVNGFDQFVDKLHQAGIGFAIITPLFGVITETLRNVYGHDRFIEIISNPIHFALDGDEKAEIDNSKLSKMIERFFIKARDHKAFDRMKATGKISLFLEDEKSKAELVGQIANRHNIALEQVAYLAGRASEADAMIQVIRHGGTVIAFNYSQELAACIEHLDSIEASQIHWTDARSRRSNLRRPAALILG